MKWEEPRRVGRTGPRAWVDEAKELRANPGRWCLLVEKSTSGAARALAGNIMRGANQAFGPAGTFEATANGVKVYARYVGSESS